MLIAPNSSWLRAHQDSAAGRKRAGAAAQLRSPRAYAVASRRDLRLDFFRGLALLFIFVDHIPKNMLAYFTLEPVAFNDAAELFIFISGYTATLVYGAAFRDSGPLSAMALIYRRVWHLYVAQIFTLVVFVVEMRYVTLWLHSTSYAALMGVGGFRQAPAYELARALTLLWQPTFIDILPLYMVLLASFPITLLLFRWHRLLPLLLSAALYALSVHFGWTFHYWPSTEEWTFNPLAWQFLYVIGATAANAQREGHPLLPRKRWIGFGALALGLLLCAIRITWTVHQLYDPMPPLFYDALQSWWNDKPNLSLLRLTCFLLIAAATATFVRRDSIFLQSRWARPVVLCGQQSLYIFCLGIPLAILGYFIVNTTSDDFFTRLAVALAGSGVLMAAAIMITRFKEATRLRLRAGSTQQSPQVVASD